MRGQAGQEGVPQDEAATPEAMDDIEVEGTDAEVGVVYFAKRLRARGRNEVRATWSGKGRKMRTEEINTSGKQEEGGHAMVPVQGSGRIKTSTCAVL